MRKSIFTSRVAALALFAVVGLVSALAPSIASLNLARAHSPGGAALTALTVTAGGTAQTLTPMFNSAVYSYTVRVDNSVAQVTVSGTPDGDGTVTADQQVNLPAVGAKRVIVVVTHTDSGTTTQTYTVLVSREGTDDPCDGGGYNPTPTAVAVAAVPIVVESTTDDYFVLYVSHDMDGTNLDLPVLVNKGEAGTTTLAENVSAPPKERYRVEKYLIADPADVDRDCIDDITELEDPLGMNPVNPATAIEPSDGAVVLPDPKTFTTLAYRQRELKFVLLDMDTDRPRVYFQNTKTHFIHEDFMEAVGLDREQGLLIRGEILYEPGLVAPDGSRGVYRYLMYGYDPFSIADLAYSLLAASMPLLQDNLSYHIRNPFLQRLQQDLPLYDASRIDLLFDKDIATEDGFVGLNDGVGYGQLRLMDLEDLPQSRDVVIYRSLPNELPRVAGIITTVPQTPLSHVNLRAIQDGIPNAFIRDALDNTAIASLLGSYVHYSVTDSRWDLRAATREEVDAHYESSRPTTPQTPQRDLSVTKITPLSDIGFDDWDAFGVKAANVAVLGTLDFPEGTVPDGFAIPFYFYDEFMKHNDFYTRIETMLADPNFQDDYDIQESQLAELRDDIEDAETPAWILTALAEMNTSFPDGINRRYRSSTNNEDLPGFNGAGLYDSKSQKPSEDEDDLAKSLKEVYASLWNFRAFTERDFHRIDHLEAAMGILVHPSYQDELVNGVAVSFDLTTDWEGRYYVNSQVGEDLVTNPNELSYPEEILLNLVGPPRILGTSNQVPPGRLLMTDAQLDQLRESLTTIHDYFERLYNPGPDEPFAMEIEFKITSENVLAIKQARPWVFGSAETVTPPTTNQAPMFTDGASTTRSVAETTTAGVHIGLPVTATDPNNDTLTYSLDLPSQATFNMVATTGQLQTKAALDYETGTHTYTVTGTATDPAGLDDTIEVTITVNNVEEPGTVTLSSLQPIEGTPLTATLDDPDDVRGSATWLWAGSPNGSSSWTPISGATTDSYTPVTADVTRFLRATASYTDGEGSGKSAQGVSTNRVGPAPVPPNEPPEFPSNTAARDVDENTVAGRDIGLPVTATDPNDDTLTYSLDLPSQATFNMVATTGQLQTKAALDYETGTHTYTVTGTATDPAGLDDTIEVTITVNNVEEPGTVTLSSLQPIEGTPLTATLDDPDDVRGSATWLWAGSPNGSSSWTPISGATTDSYTPVTADVTRFLRATASYTDGEGSGKSAQGVSTNRVGPAPVPPNEPPEFPSNTAARDVDENTVAGRDIGLPVTATDPNDDTLTYSLDLPSQATFNMIATTGQLQTKAALDYETGTHTYTVTVTATDPAGLDDTIEVTITVNNVEEPGTVTLSSLQPIEGTPLTATLDDPDDVRGSATWLWAGSPNGSSSWTPISGATTDSYTPVTADVTRFLRATASYTDGEGSGKSAQAVSANAVEVAPGRNKPVLREYPTATRSVPRNTPAGRNIGAPFSATDADNDALTYSLGGPDAAEFDLYRSSGQLLTRAPLTGINRTSYEVLVSVSDSKDDFGNPETDPLIDTSTRVTINVTTTTSSGGSSSSGGGGGGGSGRPAPTPTPTPSPTPTATPAPTGPQFSGQVAAEPSVTATVVPEGTTLGLNGGGDQPGGVYVNFPPTAVALPVSVSASVSNEAPSDVDAPSGTTLLPLTINITPETPITLGTPLTIEINPTPEQLEAAGGDLNNLAVGVVTPNGIVVLPAQVLHGRLVVTIDHLSTFVLLAVTDPGPVLTQPPMGDASSMGPLLQWTQPPRTTWFQVQVIPFNEDGPGINLVIGDGALVRAALYQVLGPNFGSADPNYVMLPDMTYLWRVRTTTVLTNPTEADWSAWAVSSFKTPPASSSTITPVAPQSYREVSTLTPTLTWANSNTAVFYYEVQVSRDYEFGPNAFLYSEYVHGGASTPDNSYVIPAAFPLEAGEIYYWRVRPRIQGDGAPLPWSTTYVFLTPKE